MGIYSAETIYKWDLTTCQNTFEKSNLRARTMLFIMFVNFSLTWWHENAIQLSKYENILFDTARVRLFPCRKTQLQSLKRP